jgi:exosortase K
MKRKVNKIRIFQLIVVLACAAALKSYYSTAAVNDLVWVLWPATVLVELITGAGFAFESNAGYMSSDHSFLIAASCSGVNFLITSFLMLAIRRLWMCRSGRIGWQFIPVSLILAYLATIAANTVRITVAFQIRQLDPAFIGLSPDGLHRLEGVVIYFGCLLILFFAAERVSADRTSTTKPIFEILRLSLVPLVIYYSMTLVVPFLNGSSHQSGFWRHSLFVLIIPILLLLPLAIISFFKHRRTATGVGDINIMPSINLKKTPA